METKMRKLINFLTCVWKLYFNLKPFESFLLRGYEHVPEKRIISQQIKARMRNEQTGRYVMSRQNAFLYLLTESYKEENPEIFKEDLLNLISILMLWYCEPIAEKQLGEE